MSAVLKPTPTGLYPGLTREAYDAIDAINVSRLAHFARTPAHAKVAIENPKPPTPAMILGTAVHCAILEPTRFAAEYVVAPYVDRRTTKGKEAWADFIAANEDKTALDPDDMAMIAGMRDSVRAHRVAHGILGGAGHSEVGIVFDEEETGVRCKGLIDRVSSYGGWTWVSDIKSTEDASPREFTRQIKNLHYGAKAAFYLDGCNTVAPRARRFAWIAVEKNPPFAIKVYEAEQDAIEAGRARYRRWLRDYDEAIHAGVWRSYDPDIQGLGKEETEWPTI